MKRNLNSLILSLSVVVSAAGCATTPSWTGNSQVSADKGTRLLEMAQHYEQSGQPQAAMRIYDHLLAQQPDNGIARDRRTTLAQQASINPSSTYALRPTEATPRLASVNQVSSGDSPSTQGSAAPQTLAPLRSLDQELRLADRLRPVGVENVIAEAHKELPVESKPSISHHVAVPEMSETKQQASDVAGSVVQPPAASDSSLAQQSSLREKTIPSAWVPAGTKSQAVADAGEFIFQKPLELDKSTVRPFPADSPPVTADSRLKLAEVCEGLSAELRPIVSRMESSTSTERIAALMELSQLGQNALQAVVAVHVLLDDPDACVRVHAAGTLRAISGDSWAAVHTLIDSLQADNDEVVCLAAYFLGRMNAEAMDAVVALAELRDHHRGMAALYAAEALTKIAPGDSQSVKSLISSLENENRQIRWLAAVMLGDVDADSEAAASQALAKAVHDADPAVSSAACLSLGGLRQHGRNAIPELRQAAQSTQADVKSAAEIALVCLGDHTEAPADVSLLRF